MIRTKFQKKKTRIRHGLTEHPLYGVWSSMKSRCRSSHTRNEEYYHRGIRVCSEWLEFLPFFRWALGNGYEKGLTLDRINNNGDYEPSNCRFTTWSVQASNKRPPQSMPVLRYKYQKAGILGSIQLRKKYETNSP